jgi:hypothetical protein
VIFETYSLTCFIAGVTSVKEGLPHALSLGVKRPEREADHSPISQLPNTLSWRDAQLKHMDNRSRMRGAISPLPNTLSWRDAQLKHMDNFIFTYQRC